MCVMVLPTTTMPHPSVEVAGLGSHRAAAALRRHVERRVENDHVYVQIVGLALLDCHGQLCQKLGLAVEQHLVGKRLARSGRTSHQDRQTILCDVRIPCSPLLEDLFDIGSRKHRSVVCQRIEDGVVVLVGE